MILLKSAEHSPTEQCDPPCLHLEWWSNTNKPQISVRQAQQKTFEAAIFVKASSSEIPRGNAVSSYYTGSAFFEY